MPHLRIESINGEVRLITADDRTLTPDIVTILAKADMLETMQPEEIYGRLAA
jgi:hypothetical protein